ncbi:RagB/SusD family nutrient uptake outer membrane protein [Namhaeicola litoreus]|uniref:RagB/SusD family nutrient uptake outer membrane protein n=1 Tax=Namhaeicola litoreus TaxID=1052145 RepID=A0ABW3XZU3_9FLAO
MKQIKYITVLLLVFFMLSCDEDFLEPAPISAVSGEDYYRNDQELEKGVINIYDGLQGENSTSSNDNHSTQVEYYLTEMRSDNTRTKSQEGEAAQFESYDVQAVNGIVYDYYRSFYNVIYRANVVIENLDNASDANRAKFEGEAKFLRAYAYFNLVRLFGDIPLIDRVVSPLEKEVQFTRVSASSIYDFIISDLETAVVSLDNNYIPKASRAGAQALLAKVHLTLGNYTDAQVLLESVMQGGFALQSNFNDVFYKERNSEIIFAIEYLPNLSDDSQNFSAEWLNAVGRTVGVNYVTTEARAALDAMGGERTQYSYRQDVDQPTQYQVAKYFPNGELGPDYASDPRLAGNDWIVLRYADVLLMHVEAIMAGGSSTSAAAALSSFQKVRDRAGFTDPVTSITKQELLDERRVELAFENQRFFDLVRFGVAQEVLSSFSVDNGYNFQSTDLLLPIPQAEIGISNGLLQQNPGYN